MLSSGWNFLFWQWGKSHPLLGWPFILSIKLTFEYLQDPEFTPPSVDRTGHAIEYYPPCPDTRMGSEAPSLKKMMKAPAALVIMTYQSHKQRAARNVPTSKRSKARHPAPKVSQPISFQKLLLWLSSSNSYFPLSQPSTTEAQAVLGASLLSQALRKTSSNPESANPKESITTETTEVPEEAAVREDQEPKHTEV